MLVKQQPRDTKNSGSETVDMKLQPLWNTLQISLHKQHHTTQLQYYDQQRLICSLDCCLGRCKRSLILMKL